MKKSEILFGLLKIPTDALAVFVALILSYNLRLEQIDLIPGLQLLEPAQTLPDPMMYITTFVVPGVCLFVIAAALLHLYGLRVTGSVWREIESIIVSAFVWVVWVMAWYFLVRKELFYSRILLVHSVFLIVVFVTVMRLSLVFLQRELLRMGVGVRTVLSVGNMALSHQARRVLEGDIRYRYLGHYHDLQEVRKYQHRSTVDLMVQTDPNPDSSGTRDLVNFCRNNHIGYAFLPPIFADAPHQLRIERLGLVPMLRFQPTPLDGWGRVWKRLFDMIGSGVLLIVLFPLVILIACGIVIDSGWPVFYTSVRIGEQGKRKIPVLKFRTMIQGADKMKAGLQDQNHRFSGPLFKIHRDPRVTSFGKILRRWSLDELPQLLNVLYGEMSLVGPRPHLPGEVKQYQPQEHRVFAIKPGITGFAQVMGRSDLTFEDEVRLDLQYIEEWSPLFDCWILARTLIVVLGRRGAD
ncbi:sugar transferase [Candidatus Peregrinibacteria bacterium]|nr:sugar transferase [Candidatus Peregrinibacteria bacterium]